MEVMDVSDNGRASTSTSTLSFYLPSSLVSIVELFRCRAFTKAADFPCFNEILRAPYTTFCEPGAQTREVSSELSGRRLVSRSPSKEL